MKCLYKTMLNTAVEISINTWDEFTTPVQTQRTGEFDLNSIWTESGLNLKRTGMLTHDSLQISRTYLVPNTDSRRWRTELPNWWRNKQRHASVCVRSPGSGLFGPHLRRSSSFSICAHICARLFIFHFNYGDGNSVWTHSVQTNTLLPSVLHVEMILYAVLFGACASVRSCVTACVCSVSLSHNYHAVLTTRGQHNPSEGPHAPSSFHNNISNHQKLLNQKKCLDSWARPWCYLRADNYYCKTQERPG